MPRSQVVTMRCDELMSCGAEHAQALSATATRARMCVCWDVVVAVSSFVNNSTRIPAAMAPPSPHPPTPNHTHKITPGHPGLSK